MVQDKKKQDANKHINYHQQGYSSEEKEDTAHLQDKITKGKGKSKHTQNDGKISKRPLNPLQKVAQRMSQAII